MSRRLLWNELFVCLHLLPSPDTPHLPLSLLLIADDSYTEFNWLAWKERPMLIGCTEALQSCTSSLEPYQAHHRNQRLPRSSSQFAVLHFSRMAFCLGLWHSRKEQITLTRNTTVWNFCTGELKETYIRATQKGRPATVLQAQMGGDIICGGSARICLRVKWQHFLDLKTSESVPKRSWLCLNILS